MAPSFPDPGQKSDVCEVILQFADIDNFDGVPLDVPGDQHLQVVFIGRALQQLVNLGIAWIFQPVEFLIDRDQAVSGPVVILHQRTVLIVLERVFPPISHHRLHASPIYDNSLCVGCECHPSRT